MSEKRIGVLGGNGNIGKLLIGYLNEQNYKLSVANRRKKVDYINQSIFDVRDEKNLERFISDNDIIVNCIGPSFHYSEYILKNTLKHSKIYIDPFGDDYILKDIRRINTSKVVISSGDYPGFTGVLPCWIKEKYFDTLENISISYKAGGNITATGLFDLLMSSYVGFGKSNYYYKNGRYERTNSTTKKRYSKFINKFLYEEEYVNKEAIDVSNKLGIREMHFKNMNVEKSDHVLFGNMYFDMLSKKNFSEKISLLQHHATMFNNSNDNTENTLYYIEARGNKDKNKQFIAMEILCKDSSAISAYMLYKSIEAVINLDLAYGKYRPFEILNSDDLIKNMIKRELILEIYEDYDISEISESETGTI